MSDRPNVIVIMTDQQKATASHLYGNTFCETPSMARLAEEGVLFRHAFTPHPLCVPARVSLWTSMYPHQHGARRNETWMPADVPHAFQVWAQAGYRTGLIGKNHCFERPEDLALFDVWCEISHGGLPKSAGGASGPQTKGMPWFRPREGIDAAHALRHAQTWKNPRFAYSTSDFPLEDYSTGLVAGQTVRFLERFKDEPFALWVSFPDPHTPWVAPRRYAEMFPREGIDLPPWRADEFGARASERGLAPERNRVLYRMLSIADDPLEDVYGLLGVYYGMVRFIDDGLGQILDALESLGLRENTIVVFTSDHGDFMGEHAMQRKGGLFYDCLTRIPMLLSWPGQVAAGQVEEGMVNLIDIVPTLFQLQGLDVPPSMRGHPLPAVTDAPPREAAFSEYGAGGPPFRMSDLEALPETEGWRAIRHSLRWREAEGRRKMARTVECKYVHDPMGDLDELYDLVHDPWELHNVAADPAYRDVLAEMQMRLLDWSIETEDGQPVPLPQLE